MTILFILAVAISVYAIGFYVSDIVRYYAQILAMVSPHGIGNKIAGVSVVPMYVLPVTVTYAIWYIVCYTA